jgi:hypothetical protein
LILHPANVVSSGNVATCAGIQFCVIGHTSMNRSRELGFE